MNVIFVGRKSGRVKQFDLRHPMIMSGAALRVLGNWSAEFLHQKAQIEDVKSALPGTVNALAPRVAFLDISHRLSIV